MKHRREKAIYKYLDYREFLRDEVAHLKEANPNFSYRAFNMKAGLKSSGHLKMIADGRLNVGQQSMHKLCKGLGLSVKETNFFVSLVQFNQAKTHQERDQFYNNLLALYPPRQPRMLGEVCYRIFHKWYYVVLLELVRVEGFCEVASWISARLCPSVPEHKVRKALQELEELGLLVRNAQGKLEPASVAIATPEAVESLAVVNYNEQLIARASEALRVDPVAEKEFSTLTAAMSEKTFAKVKAKLQEQRNELRELIESENEHSQQTFVAHINLQSFKLSKGSTS